jgi:ParB family chromosome partitioning protein
MAGKRSKTADRLGGLLSNLTDQSAGAFPTAQEVVEQVVPMERRRFVRVRLDQLGPNPRQPRRIFDENKLRDLGASIKEHGLQQPLVIRAADVPGRYDIAAGERRWRAMLLENMTEAEAIEVIDCSDEEIETIALVENVHRADLTPYELAEAYWRLHRTSGGEIRMSIAEVAAYVKQSVDHVDSHLAIMRVPAAVRQLIIDDPTIPLRTIRDLGQVENVADLEYLIGEVRSHRFTANDVTRMLQQVRKAQKDPTARRNARRNAAAVSGQNGQAASEGDGPSPATATKNISPALALAALETRLRKDDVQVRKIFGTLTEEVPLMDTDRKAAARNHAQTWVTLAQQLWELTRED